MRVASFGLAVALMCEMVSAAAPFYPDALPADIDDDLTTIHGHAGRARGERIRLGGRVVDTDGKALAGVRIELWQTDAGGRYIHSGDPLPGQRDPDFQGFGVATSDEFGRYRFTTVVPAGYASRPPHFHIRLLRGAREILITQLYLPRHNGERGIDASRLSLREASQTLRLGRAADGTLTGDFDFVLGNATPP